MGPAAGAGARRAEVPRGGDCASATLPEPSEIARRDQRDHGRAKRAAAIHSDGPHGRVSGLRFAAYPGSRLANMHGIMMLTREVGFRPMTDTSWRLPARRRYADTDLPHWPIRPPLAI